MLPTAVGAQVEDSPSVTYRTETEFRLAPAGAEPVKLLHNFLENKSLKLYVDGKLWQEGESYRLQSRSGLIIPLRHWRGRPTDADSTRADARVLLAIRYNYLPVSLPARKDLRVVSPAPAVDPATGLATGTVPVPPEIAWQTGQLEVNGSKTVQVSSGSRREMTVDQNLRLNIVGRLTDDISVRAFLSDDNLPVVPEGNTEELKDIDKVLVELQAPRWRATLGDFVAWTRGTAFGNYRRKLQGFNLAATPPAANLEVLAGSPRGLYRTLEIRGQEANQGPYYLGGGATGASLFIVAGSERVTLDGVLMKRGSEADYTVDYIRGTVTFTYRRLVTAESRIVVEFEEGEGPYGRTVVGAGGGVEGRVPWLGTDGRLGVRVTREQDDPGRLRTGELGPDDEAILAAAGDDPTLAVAPGVSEPEPGTGHYDQADEAGKTIYVYNPDGGDFNVEMFLAGSGLGDYALDRLTETGVPVFVHRGDGLGNYLIGRPLARPGRQRVATVTAALGDTEANHLSAEWNSGDNDLNLLSDLDNDDNAGQAGRLQGRLGSGDLSLGGLHLGRGSVAGFWEKRDGEFKPFQNRKTVFDYDKWGLENRARRVGFLTERESETGVDLQWGTGETTRSFQATGHLGNLHHGDDLKADNLTGTARWTLGGGEGRHLEQNSRATDNLDPLDIRRVNRRHSVGWQVGPVKPTARYGFRRWEDARITGGRASGFQLEELGARLESASGRALAWHVDFERGLADSLKSDGWHHAADSRTTSAGVTSGRVAGMRLVGEGTLRRVEQPDQPEQTTRLARLNVSGNWGRSASDWSLGYRLDNSRTAVLDRQVVFVGEGLGDYNENGEYLGPGQGDYNVIIAGTDSLVAATGVVADLLWRQGFKWLGADHWYGAWNSLTRASVTGRSTTDDVGGLLLLDPSVIFDPDAAILGDVTLNQELAFLQHIRTVDLRVLFDYRETMDRQFVTTPEDRILRAWTANGNINVSRRSSVRLRWGTRDERRYAGENAGASRRSYTALTNRYEAGLNYRATTDLRLGLAGEYITRDDRVSGVSQKEYALKPSGRHRFRKKWTVQGEARVFEVVSDEPTGSIRPWFFAYPGRNVDGSLRLSWEPSRYLTVSASWFARKQGDRRWQHDVRLESTARF